MSEMKVHSHDGIALTAPADTITSFLAESVYGMSAVETLTPVAFLLPSKLIFCAKVFW